MKTGIYRIKNTINGKSYIGSAARNLLGRWRTHKSCLKQQTHHSSKLQNAWTKYGADAFVFEVLLYCDPQNCLMYEQIALDHYKPEYNVCLVAGSCLGRKQTQETRTKISLANLGKPHGPMSNDHKKAISYANRGRICSSAEIASKTGERNHRSRLVAKQVIEIKTLLAMKDSIVNIATRFSVSSSTIADIKFGRTWSHM